MRLNSDVGESFGHWSLGNDETVIPLVDMVNIACGFHAGDPDVMARTVELASRNHVAIGAHPGYDDKAGFGRRHIPYSSQQLTHLINYQVGALHAICKLHRCELSYIKPHGALYNDMMANDEIFLAVCRSAASLELPLMILSTAQNARYQHLANDLGVKLLFEAFIDRAYTAAGHLVNRSHPHAVLTEEAALEQRVHQLKNGYIVTEDGAQLLLHADTLCVHGDNPDAIALIHKIKTWLTSA
uniref:5-oxoprolinase subunit PxpA n=1 Tax=Thaumasiovibrio occultus TaxID=1891184 RepID=UPI000B34BCFA|nr:5-oxoprolinase subunit PxpA [Thaumasiovibrio occultus]